MEHKQLIDYTLYTLKNYIIPDTEKVMLLTNKLYDELNNSTIVIDGDNYELIDKHIVNLIEDKLKVYVILKKI